MECFGDCILIIKHRFWSSCFQNQPITSLDLVVFLFPVTLCAGFEIACQVHARIELYVRSVLLMAVLPLCSGMHENPELIWNDEAREKVSDTVKRMKDECV